MWGLRGAGARSVSRAQPSRPLAQPRCEERRAWRKLATRIGEHNVRNRARRVKMAVLEANLGRNRACSSTTVVEPPKTAFLSAQMAQGQF